MKPTAFRLSSFIVAGVMAVAYLSVGFAEHTALASTSTNLSLVWGTSYVKTQERLQLSYNCKLKAGANEYSGKRIIGVCGTFTRNGAQMSKQCSNASSSSGRWVSGPEKNWNQTDDLRPNYPKTIFNYSRTMIAPNIY